MVLTLRALFGGMEALTDLSDTDETKREFLRFFVPLTFLILLGFLTLLWFGHNQNLKIKLAEERQHVNLFKNSIYRDLESLTSDILTLADSENLKAFLTDDTPETYQNLLNRFSAFSEDRKVYDKIRLLSESGMEQVRVNHFNDKQLFVRREDLQDKGTRYYFKESIVLDEHELFFSPLDLNVEHGKIESPIKPVIRVATPVFDSENTKRGVLILNYLASTMLDRLDTLVSAEARNEYTLVNKDGYWLDNPDPDKEWGFMYDRETTIGKSYPNTWKRIQGSESGQISSNEGVFTFERINPALSFMPLDSRMDPIRLSFPAPETWMVISHLDNVDVNFNVFDEEYMKDWALFLVLIFIIAAISWRLGHERQIRGQTEINLFLSKMEAERANAAKSEFLAAMSHDLRTPLNAIMGFADMMQQKTFGPLGDKRYDQYVTDIHDSGSLLVSLINDILDLSKIESGKYELKLVALDVQSVIENRVRQLEHMANTYDQTISIDIPEGMPRLFCDERALIQVLNNLMSNAIKFNVKGGKVDVSGNVGGDRGIVLRVRDSGLGMSSGGIEKALKPFEQANGTYSRRHQGTGLGLYLCVNFMELFGGDLKIESDVGKGTVVALHFPPKSTVSS
jgi:signal transduction histidine kinase